MENEVEKIIEEIATPAHNHDILAKENEESNIDVLNIDEETQHLRRHNNPYFHEDKNEPIRIASQRKIMDTSNE